MDTEFGGTWRSDTVVIPLMKFGPIGVAMAVDDLVRRSGHRMGDHHLRRGGAVGTDRPDGDGS